MEMIDQLVYTWSKLGLSGSTAGFRLRAASQGLSDPLSERYKRLEAYFPYNLPTDVRTRSVSAANAPICLAFIDTGRERILMRKEKLDADAAGRPGAYLTHLLAGLPATFTARDAISLWHADDFWITTHNPLNSQQLVLPQLTTSELSKYPRTAWKISSLSHFQASLHIALSHFLRSSSPQRLCLSGSSEAIAALIWGVTQSLPSMLLPRLTFNTYEDNLRASRETIVGLFSDRFLPTDGPSFNVDTASTLPYSQETDTIQKYITFATDILCQRLRTQQQNDELNKLISLAEQREIRTVDALLELFQEQRAVVVPSVQPKRVPHYPPVPPMDEPVEPSTPFNPPIIPTPKPITPSLPTVPDRSDNIPDAPHIPVPFDPPVTPAQPVPSYQTNGGDPHSSKPPLPVLSSPAPTRDRIRTTLTRFWRELRHARSSRSLYRGTIFSLTLNALLLATLLILLIALPISQNAARQSGSNNALAQITSTATTNAQATSNAQATVTNETNSATFIPQNWKISAPRNTPFILSVQVQNTGTRTWLPGQGYQLKCIPITSPKFPIDSDCPTSRELDQVTTPVSPGQFYIFSFTYTSKDAIPHLLNVQMFQGQIPVSKKFLTLSFKIT